MQGGTTKLERHSKLHTKEKRSTNCFTRTLLRAAKQKVAESAALAAVFDIPQLSFRDKHVGMADFCQNSI